MINSNYDLKKFNLCEIKQQHFREAMFLAYACGVTSKAPMGYSGDEIVLFGLSRPSRVSLVSVRNHSGSPQLLITDRVGNFIFLGSFHLNMGIDYISRQFWLTFKMVYPEIEK